MLMMSKQLIGAFLSENGGWGSEVHQPHVEGRLPPNVPNHPDPAKPPNDPIFSVHTKASSVQHLQKRQP
eukprot:1070465-Pelagomonas_calceolata.AAC.1